MAPRRGRRVLAWLLGSLLAHALVMALLLLEAGRDREDSRSAAAPSIEIVFEGGSPERSAAEPPPGFEVPPAPPAPVMAESVPAPPPGSAPPTPVPEPTTPPPPLAVPPPVLPPPGPAFPEARVVPPPAPRLPPPPVTAVPPPPSIVALIPPPPPPPEEAPEEAPLPTLADILPPSPPLRLRPRFDGPPRPAVEAPRETADAPRRQAAPALPPGTVFVPGGVQLGGPPQAALPPGRRQAQGLDLTVDPRLAEGAASADPSVRVTGAQVGADWRAAFRRWLDQNIRYPMRALELGESGTVRVQVIVAPNGEVRSVRLTGPSVSPSLNFGTTFPFSGATLPAFPPPADPNGVTVDLTVNYVIIRR